jgi:hypothetical protein
MAVVAIDELTEEGLYETDRPSTAAELILLPA